MRYEIISTTSFDKWLQGLKDRTTRNKVLARIDRIQNGNFGDFKSLDNNLFELRLFFGGGCVFTIVEWRKQVQPSRDIEKARQMIQELE